MDSEDWATIVANATQLLKPGSAIQCVEPASMSAIVLRGHGHGHGHGYGETRDFPVTPPQALNKCNEYFKDGLQHRLKADHLDLPAIFEHHGLSQVSQDVIASDRDAATRAAVTSITYAGYMAYMRLVHEQGIPGAWKPEYVEKMRREWEEEITHGAYLRFDIYVTIGVKEKREQESNSPVTDGPQSIQRR